MRKDNALLLLEIGLKMHFRFDHRELIRSIHGRKSNSFTNILDKKDWLGIISQCATVGLQFAVIS